MLRSTGAHRRCGFNGAESRYFGEVMHFLLTIHPQLLHQLEGIHVSAGTAGSDLFFFFKTQYRHCKERKVTKFSFYAVT